MDQSNRERLDKILWRLCKINVAAHCSNVGFSIGGMGIVYILISSINGNGRPFDLKKGANWVRKSHIPIKIEKTKCIACIARDTFEKAGLLP